MYDLLALCLEDRFEDSSRVVDQVRQRLVEGALGCHVDGLKRQLSWVPTLRFRVNHLGHRVDLCLRQEAQCADEADYQVVARPIHHAQVSQLVDGGLFALFAAMQDDDEPRSALLLRDEEVGLDPLEILVDDLGPDSGQRGLLWKVQGAELLHRLLHNDPEVDDVSPSCHARAAFQPCCRCARELAVLR